MKLEIPSNKKKPSPPSSNKGEKAKKVKVQGKLLFNPLTYAYEENEKVIINQEGLKQITNLKKDFYRVIAIRLVDLGDMLVNVMDLDVRDDENIVNPYLANHFSPLEPTTNEEIREH